MSLLILLLLVGVVIYSVIRAAQALPSQREDTARREVLTSQLRALHDNVLRAASAGQALDAYMTEAALADASSLDLGATDEVQSFSAVVARDEESAVVRVHYRADTGPSQLMWEMSVGEPGGWKVTGISRPSVARGSDLSPALMAAGIAGVGASGCSADAGGC